MRVSMKKCTKCGIEKPLSEFQKRKEAKDGHRNECICCRNKYNSTLHRKNKYSIEENDFSEMIKSQNYKCAICFNLLKPKYGTHIDHSHKNGKVRGILCNPCNRGLGYLQDSEKILESALKYIQKYN
jgi:hypothetical protein